MRLLIGAPMRRREWIVPDWLAHIEAACFAAGVTDHQIITVADPDDPGVQLLRNHGRPFHLVDVDENLATADTRDWSTPGRYDRMVHLRNLLLHRVRDLQPDLFLSLDTDILIHPLALDGMGTMIGEGFDAVGGKAYMTRIGNLPNYGMLTGAGTIHRADTTGRHRVDIIMALKLMTPLAYHVDYQVDSRGEDIGFALAARRAGLRFGWFGDVASKHVMHPDDLNVIDERCGY